MSRQFLHSSPLMLFLGWPMTIAFGAYVSYAIVCTSGFALLFWAISVRLQGCTTEQRRTMIFIALSTPLLLVLCRWLGKSDPYLLALFLLMLAHRDRPLPSAVISLLMVLSHREIGTIMVVTDSILRKSLKPSIVLGAGLGIAAVALYQAELSVRPFSRVDFALAVIKQGMGAWERIPFAHVLLSFSWFWMILFARGRTPDWPRVALAIALCFAVSVSGADYTRDLILCAFPVVVYTAEAASLSPALRNLVATRPFPLAFLLQAQLESFDQISDSQWLGQLISTIIGFLHKIL